MSKKKLLQSAALLKSVSSTASSEYFKLSGQLESRMNLCMLQLPQIDQLIGADNEEMMKDNHANHVQFMNSILKYPNPKVFVDTVIWVFRTYRRNGFSVDYWKAQMQCWTQVLKEVLSEKSYQEIHPYYQWLSVNIPLFKELSDDSFQTSTFSH